MRLKTRGGPKAESEKRILEALKKVASWLVCVSTLRL